MSLKEEPFQPTAYSKFLFFSFSKLLTISLANPLTFCSMTRKIPLSSQAFEDFRLPSISGLILGSFYPGENQLCSFLTPQKLVPILAFFLYNLSFPVLLLESFDSEHSCIGQMSSEQTQTGKQPTSDTRDNTNGLVLKLVFSVKM